MQKKIVFRHMDSTPAMEVYANKQLRKVEAFLEKEQEPVRIELVLEPSKVHAHHRIELIVKSAQYDRVSSYEGPDFYDVLDRVIDVMYKELHEDKRRRVDDLRKREKFSLEEEGVETDDFDDEYED